mmetsp:Transcript_4477/g.13241  ORF Transcript_4477/g.13241 Transcript_4477/m.13241 type:complete len:456 (+) Transcript_4477:290-1657(+)
MSRTTCPTLRPTLAEFEDFDALIARAEEEARGAGICKIVTPPNWRAGQDEVAAVFAGTLVGEPRTLPGKRAAAVMARPDLRPIQQFVTGVPGAPRGVLDVAIVPGRATSGERFREKVFADAEAERRRKAEEAERYRRRGVSSRRASNGVDGAADVDYDDAPDAAEVAARAVEFWRSLAPHGTPPEYGADVDGTTFGPEETMAWNLDRMPRDRLRPFLAACGARIPGVTNGMLYFGGPRAFFAWHIEDANLYSVNYLHCGAPKSWYALAPARARSFEKRAGDWWREAREACRDFLRHKTSMVAPPLLRDLVAYDIDLVEAVQRPGDLIVTFPGGYHCGFNHGFNVAESTNFATDRWAAQGRGATACACCDHSVRIDVAAFERWTVGGVIAPTMVVLPPPPPDPAAPRARKSRASAEPGAQGSCFGAGPLSSAMSHGSTILSKGSAHQTSSRKYVLM